MAVTHVNTQTSTGPNDTSIAITKPTGTVSGHVLVAVITTNNQNVTAPSGWTQIFDDSNDVFRSRGFYRVAGGSEGSSYTFTVPAACPMVGSISAYSGCDTTTPLDIAAVTANTTTHAEPYTTPSLPGTSATSGRVLYVRAVRYASSGSIPTFTASMSERADVGVYSGGSVAYAHALYEDAADYSDTSTKPGLGITCSLAESHNVVATFALKSSAVPGSMDATIASMPGVALSGTVEDPATMSMVIPAVPDASFVGFGSPPMGTIDTVVTPDVNIVGTTLPRGTMDVVMPVLFDFVAETRRLTGNVYVVPPEERWAVVHQDDVEFKDGRKTHREFSFEAELKIPVVHFTVYIDIGTEPIQATVFPLSPSVAASARPDTVAVTGTAYGPEAVLTGAVAGSTDSSVTVYDAMVKVNNTANTTTVAVVALDPSSTRVGGKSSAISVPVTVFSPTTISSSLVQSQVVINQSRGAVGVLVETVYATCVQPDELYLPMPQINFAAKKVNIVYAANIGDGTNSSFTVTHNLGSRDVLIGIYEAASPYEEVLVSTVERTTTNTCTVTFPTAPSLNQYRIVVVYG